MEEDFKGKLAIIAVDYLEKDGLVQGDLVEILDQREEPFFIDHKVTKIEVRSLRHPNVKKEIFKSEVVAIRDKNADSMA